MSFGKPSRVNRSSEYHLVTSAALCILSAEPAGALKALARGHTSTAERAAYAIKRASRSLWPG